MRVPWLIIGTLGGLVFFAFVRPMISDVHGFSVIWWALACLIGGLLVGFFMDGGREVSRPPAGPKQ